VETWRRAGEKLERIRQAGIQSVDTRKAVRQLFGNHIPATPAPPTSGLVEQHAWFARFHQIRRQR
jgi:hypothetical protein